MPSRRDTDSPDGVPAREPPPGELGRPLASCCENATPPECQLSKWRRWQGSPHRENWADLRAVLPVGPGTARRRRAAGKDPEFGGGGLSAGTPAFSVIRTAAWYTPFAALRAAVPTGGRRSLACASLRLVAWAPRRAPSWNCTFHDGRGVQEDPIMWVSPGGGRHRPPEAGEMRSAQQPDDAAPNRAGR